MPKYQVKIGRIRRNILEQIWILIYIFYLFLKDRKAFEDNIA